jgi:hypothetical protein
MVWGAHAELGKASDDSGDLKSSQAEVQTALALARDRMRLHITLSSIYQRKA